MEQLRGGIQYIASIHFHVNHVNQKVHSRGVLDFWKNSLETMGLDEFSLTVSHVTTSLRFRVPSQNISGNVRWVKYDDSFTPNGFLWQGKSTLNHPRPFFWGFILIFLDLFNVVFYSVPW